MRLAEHDVLILKHLVQWADQSFPKGALNVRAQHVAQTTGLHRNTVQRRIRALRDGGVIDGFLFEPHPDLLGLVRAGDTFWGMPTLDTDTIGQRLAHVENVSMCAVHADSAFLHTWHEPGDDIDAFAQRIKATLGAQGWAPGFRIGAKGQPALSALERRILLAVRRGFTRSVERVAQDAGTTRRNAARYLQRLGDGSQGALIPMFRPGNVEGTLFAVFTTTQWDASTYGKLAKAFSQRIMGPMAPPTSPMVLVPVASVQQATHIHERAKSQGLADLQLAFLRDVLFPPACDQWLAKRVQNAPPDDAKA